MRNTNDDCEFHFVRVEVIQVIGCSEPFGVEPERINAVLLLTMSIARTISFPVATAEDVEGKREELVINPSAVKGKYAHQQQQVSNSVQGSSHLFGLGAVGQPDTQREQDSTMANVSEHDSEKEGKYWDRKQSWVHFLIPRHTISIDDFLERSSEFVHLEVCWGFCWLFCLA